MTDETENQMKLQEPRKSEKSQEKESQEKSRNQHIASIYSYQTPQNKAMSTQVFLHLHSDSAYLRLLKTHTPQAHTLTGNKPTGYSSLG